MRDTGARPGRGVGRVTRRPRRRAARRDDDAPGRPADDLAGRGRESPGPAPGLGEHTAEVLAELGYDAARVDGLRQRNAV